MLKKLITLILFVVLSILTLNAQTDSLLKILSSKSNSDSLRIKAGIQLCMKYSSNNPDSCILISNQVQTLISKQTERYLPAALRLKGVAFVNKGEYKKSLNLYFDALRVAEKQGNKKEIASINNNIGVNFWYQNDFKKAKQYYEIALEYRLKLKDKKEIAKSFNNLGTVERELGQFDGALNHYNQSLNIKIELDDHVGIANSYNNIGAVYEQKKDLIKASEYYKKAFVIFRMENDKRGVLVTFNNLAGIYKMTKKYKEAYLLAKEAFQLSQDLGSLEDLRVSSEILAKASYDMADYKEAYNHLTQYLKINDSIIRGNNVKIIAEVENKYQNEKNEKEIRLLENENKLKETEIENNKKQKKYYFAIISLIVLVLGLGILSYSKIRTSNGLLTQQKIVIENQKELVEEKNRDIVDSINYAKRIQEAMLKAEQHSEMDLPAHFILFKPKDIVSGDFYWLHKKSNYLYITAADCTGHGVPGAFLTMLGTSFLNEINAVEEILTPAEILTRLRDKIVKELSQNGKTKDGMDVSLARLNLKTNELSWAGANNPLWIIKKEGKIFKAITPDKQPVGFADNMHVFTNHQIDLNTGDTFYLITDGFADQFGGPKGKKFKYNKLQSVLIENVDKAMNEQKEILATEFENWRNWQKAHGESSAAEQVDDVCLIGMRVG